VNAKADSFRIDDQDGSVTFGRLISSVFERLMAKTIETLVNDTSTRYTSDKSTTPGQSASVTGQSMNWNDSLTQLWTRMSGSDKSIASSKISIDVVETQDNNVYVRKRATGSNAEKEVD